MLRLRAAAPPSMAQRLQLAACIALAVLAGQAAAQIFPNVPFWNIKPALHTNGVMRYRIFLNGRSYCSSDTRGYLVAPFCKTWEAGNVITSVAAADKLVAASVGQKKTGRRLTATDEELGLVDGQTWYWCRDSKTKAWKKCDVASAIAGSTSSNTGNGGGGGGGSGGAGGGSDDVAAQKAARQAAAREREESSRGPKVSAATNSNNWMYSNTGGYYRHVPRPLLNAFVEYDYGQWDLWADSQEGLNPDGSAWGVPLSIESVGRRDVCRDNFLTSSRFSDGVYTGPAGDDRFVLEPVDGYAWQLRIRSRAREIEGNPKMYLGASIWCRPYPNATFQDSCLGFYEKKDRNASTTWFFSPVNPCRAMGQTCASTAQCCNKNLKCVASNLEGGGNVCANVPGTATVSTVEQVSYAGFDELAIQVTLNIPFNGGSQITRYDLNMTSTDGVAHYSTTSETNVFNIIESDVPDYLICGKTWTFQTRTTNAAGSSPWAPSSVVYAAPPCLFCEAFGASCTTETDCCKPSTCQNVASRGDICTALPEPPTGATVSTAYDTKTAVATLTFANIQMAPDGTYGLPILRYWARAVSSNGGFLLGSSLGNAPTIVFSSSSSINNPVMCNSKSSTTYSNLQVWVETALGQGERLALRDTPTTVACQRT